MKFMKDKSMMIYAFFTISCMSFFMTVTKLETLNLSNIAVYISVYLILIIHRKKLHNLCLQNKPVNKIIWSAAALLSIVLSYDFYWYRLVNTRAYLKILTLSVIQQKLVWILVVSVVAVLSVPAAAVFLHLVWNAVAMFVSVIWNYVRHLHLKRIGSAILGCAVTIGISIAAGFILLIGVFSLPTDRIDDHVKKSAEIFQQEGIYPKDYDWCTCQQDSFTDALMLLNAADDTDKDVVTRALNAFRGNVSGNRPDDSLVLHYIEGAEFTDSCVYPRYWHGYLVPLRLLLQFFDYQEIRIINGIIQTALVIVICIGLYLRKKKNYIVPFLISYLMLMPVTMMKSLQYSSCFYILSGGIIAALYFGKNKENNKQSRRSVCFVFLLLGILTAYFDFLTYPIATFGMPVLFYMILDDEKSWQVKLRRSTIAGIIWLIGYSGMWAGKWILSTILLKENIILNALNQVVAYTEHQSSVLESVRNIAIVISANLNAFFTTPVSYLLCALCVYCTVSCGKYRKICRYTDMKGMFPFLCTAVLPVIWYMFAVNHSSIHFWFTNKALVVSSTALTFACTGFLELLHKERIMHAADSVLSTE